jgi:hypothetical protein
VNPRDPPAWIARAYGVAGQPPPLCDFTPQLAPTGIYSMHDSMRTTGGNLDSEELVLHLRVCVLFWERVKVYKYPDLPPLGSTVLVSQTNSDCHIESSTSPVTYARLENTALATYVLTGMDSGAHGRMALSNPHVISGTFDVEWEQSLQWHVPSPYIPYMVTVSKKRVGPAVGGKETRADGDLRALPEKERWSADGGRVKALTPTLTLTEKPRAAKDHSHHKAGDDDADSDGSDESHGRVHTTKDQMGNVIRYSKSKVTRTMHNTQSYRTMTSSDLRDATFASTGNELQYYDAATWCRGVADRVSQELYGDMPGERDPGCYNIPRFQLLQWYAMLKTYPNLVLKIACFAFELARNWVSDSIRLCYFLTAA